MGRVYNVPGTETTHSAAGDMIQVASASSKVTKLLSCKVTQNNRYGDANAAGLRVQIARATGAGTGGSTVTARPNNPGDAAFAGTILLANTTDATTLTVLHEEAMNIQAGMHWTPPEKGEITIAPSGILIVTFPDAPAASIDVSVQLEIEELG